MNVNSLRFFTIFAIIASFFTGMSAHGFSLDTNLFYISDSLSVTTNTTSTKMFGEVAAMIDLDKKGRWVIGWSYNYMSITQSGDSDSEFTLTEMGPKFGYYIDKQKVWSIFFTYNFQSKADYSGTSTAEWRGTSMKGEIGFTPAFSEKFHAGVKLNYYSVNFSEEFTNSTTFASISNSRSLIYPTVAFIYRFN